MTPEKAKSDLEQSLIMAGVMLLILCPLTGVIVARLLDLPFWYGGVFGGWVLLVLLFRTIRIKSRVLADFNAQAKTLSTVTEDMRAISRKLSEGKEEDQ